MRLVFLIIAILCFILAAFGVNITSALSIGWLGMAFFAATFLPIDGPRTA